MYYGSSWSLPGSWASVLCDETSKPYFTELMEFVNVEREQGVVFPSEEDMFRAFELTPFEQVRVVLLGQDPYHDEGQAHGLCFSVLPGTKPPPSLANIFKELEADQGHVPPAAGLRRVAGDHHPWMFHRAATDRVDAAHPVLLQFVADDRPDLHPGDARRGPGLHLGCGRRTGRVLAGGRQVVPVAPTVRRVTRRRSSAHATASAATMSASGCTLAM